jgi:hypothetical protein
VFGTVVLVDGGAGTTAAVGGSEVGDVLTFCGVGDRGIDVTETAEAIGASFFNGADATNFLISTNSGRASLGNFILYKSFFPY